MAAHDKPLGPVEHVVVLMYENRSFDNMVGRLYPNVPQSTYNGLTGNEYNLWSPTDPASPKYYVWSGPDTGDDIYTIPYPDPGELFADMNEQIFGTRTPSAGSPARMDGFVANYRVQPPGQPANVPPKPGDIMHYFADTQVPITSALARAFGVSDQWFASGPTQTFPNRTFAHVATPGLGESGAPRVNNTDFGPLFVGSVTDKSVFDLLDEAHPGENNWRVLYHDMPLSVLLPGVLWEYLRHLDGKPSNVALFDDAQGGLAAMVKADQLPKYTFIEPRYSSDFDNPPNSNHPGGSYVRIWEPNEQALAPAISVWNGEQLLYDIYAILATNPRIFEKTLLVVIYDEHGGCYDHVPPPVAPSPFTKPVPGFDFGRYGVRVPAFFVHPRIRPNTIFRPPAGSPYPFDHTSVIRTLREQFPQKNGTPLSALTPRDANAPSLSGLLSFNAPSNILDPAEIAMPTAPARMPSDAPPIRIGAFKEFEEALEKALSERKKS